MDTLEGLGKIAAARGELQRAARLFGAAEKLREEIGASLPVNEQRDYDQVTAKVRAALEDTAAPLWAAGKAMTLDEAVKYALS